jgi:hypothetical protein
MAFDMYAGASHEVIGHHEEVLFEFAENEPAKYPELRALHKELYSDPILSDERAGRITYELIELLDAGKHDKLVFHTVVRLLPFFSRAYRQNQPIRCVSD